MRQMVVGLGLDLIGVERIRSVHARHGERFLRRVLTAGERTCVLKYRDFSESLAGRWAAKEAALKALGTGLGPGMSWRDVEVLDGPLGRPELVFHGLALTRAQALRISRALVTITHAEGLAVAAVVLEKDEGGKA